jgi:hypothetical protein
MCWWHLSSSSSQSWQRLCPLISQVASACNHLYIGLQLLQAPLSPSFLQAGALGPTLSW